MPEDTTPPPPAKGLPPAVYALIGTIVTALVGVVIAYFQVITPKLIELHATQTAEILHINLTDTALARTVTATPPVFTATFTPTMGVDTLTPTSTSTISPSPTVTASLTPTSTLDIVGSEYCVNARSIYVRLGPGTDYSYFGALTFQDCPFFDARNPDSTWIRISMGQPDYLELGSGWVRSDLVRPTDFDTLPVIEPTPTPTPTFTPEPPPTFTPTNTPQG